MDGKRLWGEEKAWFKFRTVADRICEKYGLYYNPKPNRSKQSSYYYRQEQAGMPTRYTMVREAIDEAIAHSTNLIKDVLPVLHWGYLPIFGRYLLYNRDIDPERNMLEFYDHIDCLNTLLREIRGETMELENRSDVSLNVDVDFRIYSRRYKKIENNTIRRTIDGWYFKSTSMEGNVQKDGSGIFTDYLKQENLFYPYDGVLYALENLWDDVDDGDVEYDEYVLRIGEIANWINETDQVIDQQPKWLQYKNGDVYHINEELSCAEGNKTLNKEMKFYVYTRRWGHEDCYRIKRTDTGWYCEFMTIDSNCGKDGKGGLQNNLNHDCIFYPKEGIEYAMLKLWDEANPCQIYIMSI